MENILFDILNIIFSLWPLFLAFLVGRITKNMYLDGLRAKNFYAPIKWIIFEVILPEEVKKTPKAMENILHQLWSIYDPPSDLYGFWIKGDYIYHWSFELVGVGGEGVHFYIRVPAKFKEVFERVIYGEYPEAELKEVDDYTLKFGKDLPNEKYDFYASDITLQKPEIFPLRTYSYWETEMTRIERRIDPLAGVLEMLGNLKKGEEIWVQIIMRPISDVEHPWIEEAKALIAKTLKRKEEKEESPLKKAGFHKIPGDILKILIEGEVPKEESPPKKEDLIELGVMRLSPGEQEMLKQLEENISKYAYEVRIRFIYIARREIYSKPRGATMAFGFFVPFSSTHYLNAFGPGRGRTKVGPWPFKERRYYLRQRRLWRRYITRDISTWYEKRPYLLSTAEIATIYHFPPKEIAPTPGVARRELKRGETPPEVWKK